ncbi:hypothetical protein ACSBR1_041595 [Camellia fascicularis]
MDERSYFSTRSKCDIQVNNLSGSFNKYILPARDKPIISMMEWIRRKLMNKIQVKKNGMEKHSGFICPTVQQKLESNKEDARNCFASFASELKFEMDCYDTTHVVDLRARTCGCRDCDLTGIPCKHAISCIYLTREKPEAYVHNYFSKETYLRTYSFMINPVLGEHDWIETDYDTIAPPYFRNQRSCKGLVHKKSTMFKRRGGPTTSSRKSASQPSKFLNASSQQAARHTYSSQPSSIHLVLSQQAANTHPSSSQPAVTTQSQPTMPCGASASANGNGFTATGMN